MTQATENNLYSAELSYERFHRLWNFKRMLQQIFAILLVLGLLIATLAVLRRRGLAQFSSPFGRVSGRSKEMCVLERIGLDAHHSLFLVNVRQETFLIGVSPSGCDRIATFAPQEREA